MKPLFARILATSAGLLSGAAAAQNKTAVPADWTPNLTGPTETYTNMGRNDFFVLEPGYQCTYSGSEDGKHIDLVITVLTETKLVNGVETRVIEERESADGKLVEVSRNYFALGTTTHHVYYFGEAVDMYQSGKITSHDGSWLAGVDGAKQGIALPGAIQLGQKYYQEQAPNVAMDRVETIATNAIVHTTAGNFTHCLKVKETTPLEPGNVEYKIYAPGIGLVQDGELKLVAHGFARN